MKTTLTLYVLRHLTDRKLVIKTTGHTVDDAIENCSGGAESWEHIDTEEVPYKHAELMAATANALGCDWTAEPQSIEHADCNWYLLRTDGLKLFVSMPCYGHKNKIEISCSPARSNGSWVEVYGEDHRKLSCPKIGVGETKTPAQIAKDIERRLLTDAANYHAAVLARIASDDESASQQLATYHELCRIFQITPRQQRPGNPDTKGSYSAGSFEVHPGGSVSFKLYSISADQAPDIARTLAKVKNS